LEAKDSIQNRIHIEKRGPGVYSTIPVPLIVIEQKKKSQIIMYSDNLLQTGYRVREWSDILEYVYTMRPKLRLELDPECKAKLPDIGGSEGQIRCFAYDVSGIMFWKKKELGIPIYFYPIGGEVNVINHIVMRGKVELMSRVMYVCDEPIPDFKEAGVWSEIYDGKTYIASTSMKEKTVTTVRIGLAEVSAVTFHFNNHDIDVSGSQRFTIGQVRPGVFRVLHDGLEKTFDISEGIHPREVSLSGLPPQVNNSLVVLMYQFYRDSHNIVYYTEKDQMRLTGSLWKTVGTRLFYDHVSVVATSVGDAFRAARIIRLDDTILSYKNMSQSEGGGQFVKSSVVLEIVPAVT